MCWSQALFLDERRPPPAASLPAAAMAAAETRAGEWRQAAGVDEATFAERLAAAGLDRRGFVALLAAREAALPPCPRDESATGWSRVLEEIRLGIHGEVTLHPVQWNNPDGTTGTEPPFGSFLRPFLQCGVGRLRDGVARIEERAASDPPLIDDAVEIQLTLDLTERLTKQCSSTLILELHAARLRGLLEGDAPNERFRFFSERFFTPEKVLRLLAEVPPLARLLSSTVLRWAEATLELLDRLAADRSRLGALAGPAGSPAAAGALGTLTAVRTGVSDLHRGGRSVVIAEDGDGRKVVYKPTSHAIGVQLRRLVDAVNGFGLRHPLSTVRLLDRGEYGWQEYVEAEGCESSGALHRFYWRQGAWIALLHLLRGADVHHENLIARGEHPVLVDTEALFHHAAPSEATPESARHEAGVALHRSILRQALLPFVYRLTASGEGVDSSGLAGESGQVARGAVRRWAEPGTDRMRVVVADFVSRESRNRPTLDGEPAEATEFAADVVQGFRETYDLLAARREALHPLLDGFAGTRARYLVRPTRSYTVFLRESHHPADLRDGLDQEELFDRLWAAVAARPELVRVVAHEHRDLRNGDVPAFYSEPQSTDLWTSGGERIDGFFPRPSLLDAHRVLDGMGAGDRERQLLLIRLALSEARSRARPPAARGAASGAAAAPALEPALPEPPATDLLAAAAAVGELLGRRGLAGERGVCWITLDPFVDGRPDGGKLRNIAVANNDLYHGGSGIATFLAYLGEATGEDRFAGLARASLPAVREAMAATGAAANQALGAFLGRASYTYALLHLAALWSEPALLDPALADLPTIAELVPADEELDVLAGSAGCAVVMLRLHAATGDAAALAVARACGDHLLRRSRPVDGGIAWQGRSFTDAVAGFAHGAAGIAWALAELAAATGDERYRTAALAAIAGERQLLASPRGEPFHARVSWCHGLPSVAVARLLCSPAVDDPRLRGEIEAGVDAILGPGGPADHCLCHGVLGNAEILALCADHCGVEAWRRTAEDWAARVARGVESLDRDLLLPLHGRFSGLFCGLAGLGWGLLRFARRDIIPSVMTLAPPLAPPSSRPRHAPA